MPGTSWADPTSTRVANEKTGAPGPLEDQERVPVGQGVHREALLERGEILGRYGPDPRDRERHYGRADCTPTTQAELHLGLSIGRTGTVPALL